ncbi:Similar to Transcriptional protein SWT1; acc. no. Q12104 [Pyronema omphalodes CBS 100304]|uniref:Similar to Transcriptional protein SWT1 acc. no. Q12104 n=1 Tax=Pyronema omphalodes (strain CBS 100304) TaxID=1076935 RepID=U4LPK5_PYROM|nr:Similar to Transcriptional protein SWT1; acc. no. Q12104 [Pyronema omphalodes CBS 100304]
MPILGDISSSRWATASEPSPPSTSRDNRTRSTPKTSNPRTPRNRGPCTKPTDKPTTTTSLPGPEGLSGSRWAPDDSTVLRSRTQKDGIQKSKRPLRPQALKNTTKPLAKSLPMVFSGAGAIVAKKNKEKSPPGREVSPAPGPTQAPIVPNASHIPRNIGTGIYPDKSTPTQTIVLDEEGDTLMQDFNDPSVVRQIVGVVGGERQSTAGHILEHDDNAGSRIRASVSSARWVMVLDTNFLLSDLPLVGNLLEANRDWGNVLMVPWAVVMELDGLKKSNASVMLPRGQKTPMAPLARRVNNWVHEKMEKNEPGLWVQRQKETVGSEEARGDAAILDCCRFVKEEKKHKTALLSNDTNLCIKAMTYDIKTISVKEGKPLAVIDILSSLDDLAKDIDKHADSDINASKYVSPSPSLPAAPTPNVVASLQALPDTAARVVVSTLLQRIEYDLVNTLLPLLAYWWSQRGSLLEAPHFPPSFSGVEMAITFCLNDCFSEVFPGNTELYPILKGRQLSNAWQSWCSWATDVPSPHGTESLAPTASHIKELIDTLDTLWDGFMPLRNSHQYARCFRERTEAIGIWRSLAKECPL